jgi:hypothetical protein
MRILLLLVALGLCIGCAKRTAKNTAPARDEATSAKPHPAPNDRNKSNTKDEPNWLTDPRFKKDQPKFQPDQGPDQPNPATGPGGASGKQPWGITPPAGGWQGAVPGVQPNPNPMGAPGAAALPAGPGAAPPPGPGNVPPPGPGANPPAPGVYPAGPGVNPPPGPGANPPLAPGLPAPPGVGQLQPIPAPGNPPPLAPGAGTPIGAAKKAVALADMRDIQIFVHDASLASGKMPAPVEIFAALVKAGSPAAEHVKSGAIILTGATQREGVWAFEARAATQGGMIVSQNGVETVTAAELKQRLGK